MTGRTALFPSYEAFIGIAQTMMVQYAKFVKMAKETNFRAPNASLNYLESSTWTRQEHNGFSHQNPSFIGAVLNLKADAARVYLPPDANCFLSTIAHCINSKNYINLMVGSKHPTAVWLSTEEAEIHCRAGASVWRFCSTDEGLRPDVVLVGIGTEVTFEVIAASALLRKLAPELRVRVVNVTDLMILGPYGSHPHALSDTDFENLFTKDKKIIVNYHGYSRDVAGLVFGRKGADRMHIEGYREEGSTTTPFDMMLRNHVSRYHVAGEAVRGAALFNERVALRSMELNGELQGRIKSDHKYIVEHGVGEFVYSLSPTLGFFVYISSPLQTPPELMTSPPLADLIIPVSHQAKIACMQYKLSRTPTDIVVVVCLTLYNTHECIKALFNTFPVSPQESTRDSPASESEAIGRNGL